MIDLHKKQPPKTPVSLLTIIWKSSFLALVLTGPALGIFLGLYYSTGNLVLGVILGFSVHFIALAFSGRISKWLYKLLS